ncbi:MAG: ComEA family DNA-binding protein [Steroidobacteraceae bacterium]
MKILSLLLAAVAALPLLAWAGPVNINTADAATLAKELKGIGLVRAQAIIAYRTKNGPFRTADDLALVKGIGQRVIERNRADIRTAASAVVPNGKPAPTRFIRR